MATELTALQKAQQLGETSAQVGFDWPDAQGVWKKVEEEFAELSEQFLQVPASVERIADEMGDLLFCLANLARHLGLDAEKVGHAASAKFTRRFKWMEQDLIRAGVSIESCSLEQWEDAWRRAKEKVG